MSDAKVLPTIFTSKPIRITEKDLENKFKRADLEFHNVGHKTLSYEAQVFFNANVNHNTEPTPENGYVGSFFVLGHGGCFGDAGHCDVKETTRQYDLRSGHSLTPAYKYVVITDGLQKQIASGKKEIIVTVVPVVDKNEKNMLEISSVLQFTALSLVTYD